MQYFIGVLPPEEYMERIIDFQLKWKNNSLVNLVEPHITIKAQGGLTIDKRWISNIKKVCDHFSSFEIALNKPKFFGESVLFLSVESKKIEQLHSELVQAVSPSNDLIKKYLELEDYVPHLTLGQTNFGLTSRELRIMAEKAENELNPFPTFEVNFIRIYQEIGANKYIKYEDIQLKK